MKKINNLPNQPYKKFFGRQSSINKIKEVLLNGNTFIASIDGVGGIGKTALAYNFCVNELLNSDRFKYIVWLTAKTTVFDAFSTEKLIKNVESNFNGIESLVDLTLSTIGCEELLNETFEVRIAFFEDFIQNNPVFFVLDNLETINDSEFFKYISEVFNKYSLQNRNLKILTTSRKRKSLVDFPINIEGLAMEDALAMFKYYANENRIKDVLNQTSDFTNIKLIEKVGCIPLGIEFIIGQLSMGKTRGIIIKEIQGYPSVSECTDENEKKKRLSDIILFSFKDMYELLSPEQQFVFKVIASLQKNNSKSDFGISLELLMNITSINKYSLDNILELLLDHKLIEKNRDNYTISEMAINFVKQFYEDFELIEDQVIGKKKELLKNNSIPNDKIDIFLNNVIQRLEKNEYEDAEIDLHNALDVTHDFRVFFKLAEVQKVQKKYTQATDNYKMATELNKSDARIWYDWINMEDSRGRYNVASDIVKNALINTNFEISIVLQKIDILYFSKELDILRKEVLEIYSKFKIENRLNDLLKLLKKWKTIEYAIFNIDNSQYKFLFNAIDYLLREESDIEERLNILNEAIKNIDKHDYKQKDANILKKVYEIRRKIKETELRLYRSITSKVNLISKKFNEKDYTYVKKECNFLIAFSKMDEDKENLDFYRKAIRFLFQVLASERNYKEILNHYENYLFLTQNDETCERLFLKAKSEKEKIERIELTKEILLFIETCEFEIRLIIMKSLNNSENELISLIEIQGKRDWLEIWNITKNKSLAMNGGLIHYSDLSQLRSLLSWTRTRIIETNKSDINIKDYLIEIVKQIESYFTLERNESFHSRLQLMEMFQLNEFMVDLSRLHRNILNLKKSIFNGK